MPDQREAVLLRAFFSENDKYGGIPLHESLVLKAREMHLAGATVLRGLIGFGRSNRIHTAKILRLSFEQPIVFEAIDTRETIDRFLSAIDQMMTSGIVTLENVRMIRYGRPEGLRRAS
jgi:uncharacterized protein